MTLAGKVLALVLVLQALVLSGAVFLTAWQELARQRRRRSRDRTFGALRELAAQAEGEGATGHWQELAAVTQAGAFEELEKLIRELLSLSGGRTRPASKVLGQLGALCAWTLEPRSSRDRRRALLCGLVADSEELGTLAAEALSTGNIRERTLALLAIGLRPERSGAAAENLVWAALRQDDEAILARWALRSLAVRSRRLTASLVVDAEPLLRRIAIRAAAYRTTKSSSAAADGIRWDAGVITAGLSDADESVRREACLGLRGVPGPVPLEMLERALRDSSHDVRLEAALLLAEREGEEGAESLYRRLGEEDPERLPEALEGIGRLRQPPVADWIAVACDTSRGDRAPALAALSVRPEDGIAEALLPLLSHAERNVRRRAAWCFARLARVRGRAGLPSPVNEQLLRRLGDEPSASTSTYLVEAVAVGGDAGCRDVLLERTLSAPDRLREDLVDALAVLELRLRAPRGRGGKGGSANTPARTAAEMQKGGVHA